MGVVTLWLQVVPADRTTSGLWTKRLNMDFAPREGDRIHIVWQSPEGPTTLPGVGEGEWGCPLDVKRPYFNGDGSYHLDLRGIKVDPNHEWVDQNFQAGHRGYHMHPWFTDRDGDLEALLRASGWTPA